MIQNYRKIYEKHYGFKVPHGFDIHHIDGKRSNNDISNLLMLPHDLHMKYHNIISEYKRLQKSGAFDGCLKHYNQYNISVLIDIGKVLEQCQIWMLKKCMLDLRILNGDNDNGSN